MPAFSVGRVERAADLDDVLVELIDARAAGEVDPHRLDLDAPRCELAGGVGELVVLGCDDQVVAVVGELLRELESDAARCAGHERQRTFLCPCHCTSPF